MTRKPFWIEWRLRPEHHAKGRLAALHGWCRYRAYRTAPQRDQALAALQHSDRMFEYRAGQQPEQPTEAAA
jgi:hypothetical protein